MADDLKGGQPHPGFLRLMEAYGVSTREQLQEATGASKSGVQNWVVRGPSAKALRSAHLKTGRSLEWLAFGVELPSFSAQSEISDKQPERLDSLKNAIESTKLQVAEIERALAQKYGWATEAAEPLSRGRTSFKVAAMSGTKEFVVLPRIAAPAPAGSEFRYGDESVIGEIAFETTWMTDRFGKADDSFALVDVVGDAMTPTFLAGDTVMVDRQLMDLDKGGIFVVRHGHELLVRRIHKQLSGALQISADNPAVLPEVAPPELAANIIGRVVWPRSR